MTGSGTFCARSWHQRSVRVAPALRLLIALLALVGWSTPSWAAAGSAEDRTFKAATLLFDQTMWEMADQGLADFVQKYPTSAHLPEAYLLQAAARVHMTNYASAIE